MLIALLSRSETQILDTIHAQQKARPQKQSQAFPSGESHKYTHARSLIPNTALWDRFSQKLHEKTSFRAKKGESQ